MKINILFNNSGSTLSVYNQLFNPSSYVSGTDYLTHSSHLPEILVITSYPQRECGIATYSHDLIKVLNNKFGKSFKINICPIESNAETHRYTEATKYVLNVDVNNAFTTLAKRINDDNKIGLVMIQHEFGFF